MPPIIVSFCKASSDVDEQKMSSLKMHAVIDAAQGS
jgi:hypothetical protein